MKAVFALLAAAGVAFAAPPVNPQHRRFMAIGDWGGESQYPYYNPQELATAQAMAKFAAEKPVDFALMLGDNFYDKGIQGDVHSIRFEATFENVFNASSLQGYPWFITLGNHDYEGNYTAEVAYTELSERWELPEKYYTETITYPAKDGDAGFTVQLVSIDTVELAGLTSAEDPTDQPSGPADASLAESQWTWIEDTLSQSTADFLLVFGHYPVISGCSHGPTAILDLMLQPMLEKYGAHYFCGHDHCQEYAEYKGVSYILTGAGHGCCYDWTNEAKNPAGSIKWHHASDNADKTVDAVPDAGFAVVDLNSTAFVTTYYDASLNVQYTTPAIKARSKN